MPRSNRSRNIMRKASAAKKMMATIPLVLLKESAMAYFLFYFVFFKEKTFFFIRDLNLIKNISFLPMQL
jgi:hypothetical protein